MCDRSDAKTASSGRAEVVLDHLAHGVERLGRDLIAALLELGDQLGREQPLAAGDDLAELDVGRAEPLGRAPQPAGDVGAAGLGRSRSGCVCLRSHHGRDRADQAAGDRDARGTPGGSGVGG